jgi:prophage regulatory protein
MNLEWVMVDTFMRKRDVLKATGLSHSVLYVLIARGEFPRPIKLGQRAVAWSASEIAKWQQARMRQRDEGKE